jgi:hypothetical protein
VPELGGDDVVEVGEAVDVVEVGEAVDVDDAVGGADEVVVAVGVAELPVGEVVDVDETVVAGEMLIGGTGASAVDVPSDGEDTSRVADIVLSLIVLSVGVICATIWYVPAGRLADTGRVVTTVSVVPPWRVPSEVLVTRDEEAELTG